MEILSPWPNISFLSYKIYQPSKDVSQNMLCSLCVEALFYQFINTGDASAVLTCIWKHLQHFCAWVNTGTIPKVHVRSLMMPKVKEQAVVDRLEGPDQKESPYLQ